MDFSFDEVAQELADLTRQVLATQLPDEAISSAQYEADGYAPPAWQGLVEAGVLEAFLPLEADGAQAGPTAMTAMLREVGQRGAMVPALSTLALGLVPLAAVAGEEHHSLLREIAAGEAWVTGAIREPGGRGVRDVQTIARRDGDQYRLTGVKSFVPFGRDAGVVLVPARLADGGVGLFLVPAAGAGITWADHPTACHLPTARLELDDVAVPANALLQAEDPGQAAELFELTALTGVAALASGVLETAMKLTAEHVKNRRQFGRALAEFQAVTMRISDVYVANLALDNAVRASGWLLAERGAQEARRTVTAATYLVCQEAVPALFSCQHLHGGTGLDLDYPLHRYFTTGLYLDQLLGGTEACLDAAPLPVAAPVAVS
ncbi:acyl-CoA dehydrogenase family protein [Georgenia sp. AZ-5]|uniref:acyl-CoA dehydrogenase family protein n=1 Tax=Georgenia sp. AZ-5 TaxID=3367526 RepID=UPI00375427A5